MRNLTNCLAGALALGAASLGLGGTALAAGDAVHIPSHEWSFQGPFGTFDEAELQRGWQVYMQVCASCHGMEHMSYRSLGEPNGPNFPPEQVKAIAAAFTVTDIDADGEQIERPATPSDKMVDPFPNAKAAAAANGGAAPPPLALITKARAGCHGIFNQLINGSCGPEYVYAILTGYTDEPPEGFDVGASNYNKYFPGHKIAMPPPLYEDGVEYQDGTPATVEQMAHDVTAFLTWAGEPHMVERKAAGMRNLIYLAIFAVLLWYSNKKLWKPVKYGDKS